jgi:hypothetical protein
MFYRVTYQSMTAFYGPSIIEADSEYEAKRKFCNNGTFSQGEMACMRARPVSSKEIANALREQP